MADTKQNIAELPVKVASGIAATDHLLGIDAGEGYQMLIQDLGDYIIQNVTSALGGAVAETLVDALARKVPAPDEDGTAGQVLRTNGDGTTEWEDNASAEEIAADVTDWLDEHVAGGTTLAIDNTLTISGAAADSKAAGDRIGAVGDSVDDLSDTVEALSGTVETLSSTVETVAENVDTKAPAIYSTASGALATFSDGADDMPIKSLTVGMEPVQAGSGDPSPENVRPIAGWESVKVTRTGKNLLAKPFDHRDNAPPTLSNCFFVKAGSYTFSFDNITATTWRIGVRMMDAEGNALTDDAYQPVRSMRWHDISNCWLQGSNSVTKQLNFTFITDCYIRIIFNAGDTTTSTTATGAMLEAGSAATDFTPYTGDTYDISFPTEAGTVYGGTLDVGAGTLTVDRAMVTLDGTENWTMYAEGKFFAAVVPAEAAAVSADYISNLYPFDRNGDSQSSQVTVDKHFYGQRSFGRFWVYDSGITTVDAFKAMLANTPMTIVYPLTNPQTYTLTPQAIRTLLGINTMWADCGDIEDVTYPADTKLYIDGLTQPDSDMVADANIQNEKYFSVNNKLYLATAAIAAGEAIVPGTNCTETSLADALNTINT